VTQLDVFFSNPFSVSPSYADRLRNRQPHDMTGNFLVSLILWLNCDGWCKNGCLFQAVILEIQRGFNQSMYQNYNLFGVVNVRSLSDSEKFHEMSAATASPPHQCFLLDDDGQWKL
jgi:hypothetical protein